jgi:hypothetical protein
MHTRLTVLALIASSRIAFAEDEVPVGIPSVMDHRWALSMAYGASALNESDVSPILLGFELSARARLRADIELGLTLAGGFSRRSGWGAVFGDLRYHWFPEHAWNAYLLVGVGAAGVFPTTNTGNGLNPAARVGIGLERRFEMWSFAGELQGLAVYAGTRAVSYDPMSETTTTLGASLLIDATYYFGSPRSRRCEREFRGVGCVR